MCPPAWKYARESAMATHRGDDDDEYQSVNACVYTIRRKRSQKPVSRVRVCERYGHARRRVYVCLYRREIPQPVTVQSTKERCVCVAERELQ